jgi:hypothetical protein
MMKMMMMITLMEWFLVLINGNQYNLQYCVFLCLKYYSAIAIVAALIIFDCDSLCKTIKEIYNLD